MRILRTKQEQSNRSVASAVVSWSAEVVTMRTCWQLLVIHGVLRQWLAAQAVKSSDAMAEIKRKACLLLFRFQVIALNNLSFPSSPATCLIAQGSDGIKYPFILLFEFGQLVCGRRLNVPPVLCRSSYGVAQTFMTSDINDVPRRKLSKTANHAHTLIHS